MLASGSRGGGYFFNSEGHLHTAATFSVFRVVDIERGGLDEVEIPFHDVAPNFMSRLDVFIVDGVLKLGGASAPLIVQDLLAILDGKLLLLNPLEVDRWGDAKRNVLLIQKGVRKCELDRNMIETNRLFPQVVKPFDRVGTWAVGEGEVDTCAVHVALDTFAAKSGGWPSWGVTPLDSQIVDQVAGDSLGDNVRVLGGGVEVAQEKVGGIRKGRRAKEGGGNEALVGLVSSLAAASFWVAVNIRHNNVLGAVADGDDGLEPTAAASEKCDAGVVVVIVDGDEGDGLFNDGGDTAHLAGLASAAHKYRVSVYDGVVVFSQRTGNAAEVVGREIGFLKGDDMGGRIKHMVKVEMKRTNVPG